jgi:RNA polymerase sigma-54 factor
MVELATESAVELKSTVKTTQRLSAEVRQGVNLLELAPAELGELLLDAAEQNPFLTVDEHLPCRIGAEHKEASHVNTDALMQKLEPRLRSGGGGVTGEIRREYGFEQYLVERPQMSEYLEQALALEISSKRESIIGSILIGNIDANGYLRANCADIAHTLGVSLRTVEHVLSLIQHGNPPGIGARNLAECLLVQLEEKGLLNGLAAEVVGNHLDKLADRRLKELASMMSVEVEAIQELLDQILTCNPKPGLCFEHDTNLTVSPEIEVHLVGDRYQVRIRDFDLPQLKISDEYRLMMTEGKLDKTTRAWMQEQLRLAEGLISGVAQRRQTIIRVSMAIVHLEQGFLRDGIAYLRPLRMREVAELLSISESTVSRVANGTWIQTPRGTFELRWFFDSVASDSNSLELSSRFVKHRIRELIDAEDPYQPLSDQAICSLLGHSGITISRRTVSKYRMSMQIPATDRRKRF